LILGLGLYRRALGWNVVVVLIGAGMFAAVRGNSLLPSELSRVGFLLVAFVAVYAAYSTTVGLLRGEGRLQILPRLDLGWNFAAKATALGVGLMIPQYVQIFSAYVVVDLIVVGLAVFAARGALRTPSAPFGKEASRFARLILAAELFKILSRTVDIYAVRLLLDAESTGIFTAGARFSMAVEQIVLTPIGIPFLYYFSHPETAAVRRFAVENGTRLVATLVGFGAIVLAVCSKPIVLILLGDAFAASIPVLRVYAGHAVGASLLILLVPLYQSRDVPQFGIFQALAVFALTLCLDVALIPRYGVLGASVAGVVATALVSLAAAWFVWRRFGVDIRAVSVRVLAVYAAAFSTLFSPWPWIAIPVYVLGVFAFRLLKAGDRELLKSP